MLKYSLLITALTATGAFAFNYDSYAPVEMKFFQNISENYEKQDGPGVGSFSNKFRLILPISAKPTRIRNDRAIPRRKDTKECFFSCSRVSGSRCDAET